jgi:cell division protease FtsH
MLLVMLANWAWLLAPRPSPALQVSYSAFLALVRADQVSAATLAGQSVEATFTSPYPWPPEGEPPPGIEAPSSSFGSPPASFERLQSVLPASGDERLLPLLEQHGVVVSVRDVSSRPIILDLLVGLLPGALLVGFLIFLARQQQRGQQSLFGFTGSKARVYTQERPGVTFADVAGEDEAKAELQEVVGFLKEPERYRALGAHLPRGVLLVGPPGSGKTLLARAVAGEAGVPFMSISASEFVEMFVGVGAGRVRDLFDKAKKAAPSIVFVDELDAVGRQRGAGLGGGNDEREQTLNQLLVEMDGFDEQTNVIVLAATNRPDILDPALLRRGRFDRQITLGLPDRPGREAILRIHTRNMPLAEDVELARLAQRTPGFSGADLANLANEAALAAARRDATRVAALDFEEAMDKVVLGTRQAALLDEQERRLVAYHEGGHAVVAYFTPGADRVSKVTIIPHGRSLGATEQLAAEERRNYPRDYLVGRLAVLLGGRAAESLVYGQPTTGAESDLKEATALARRMVGLWGMSDELGPAYYGLGEVHPFLGREMALPKEYAEATAAELDRAVRRQLELAYRRASETLRLHRPLLDRLANELLLRETVDAQRLEELFEAEAPVTPVTSSRSSVA